MFSQRIAALCLGVLLTGAIASADPTPTTRRATSIFDFGLEEEPTSSGDKAAPVVPPTAPRLEAPKPPAPPDPKVSTPPAPPPRTAVPPSAPPAPGSQKPAPLPQVTRPPPPQPPQKPILKASQVGWHLDENGVLTADDAVTFGLRGTEGKHFIVTGEIYSTADHDGGTVFRLRRIDNLHDLSLTILGLHAKRILIAGEKIKRFADPFTFTGIPLEQWHAFRVEVAADGVTARFDDQTASAKGLTETKGPNSIFMKPGAKLRKLSVQIVYP